MPVRVSRFRELCRQCRDKTELACFRCKTPYCAAHLPKASDRCGTCEADFRRWPSREPAVLGFGALMLGSWAALTVVLIDLSPIAAVLWALLFPMGVGVGAVRELRCGRQLFLRQETRPKALADSRPIFHD